MAVFERANWWLRDPASATNFANVNNNGNCNYNNASNTWVSVRPDFGRRSIGDAPGYRKEKLSLALSLNASAEMRSCRNSLLYAMSYDEWISGV